MPKAKAEATKPLTSATVAERHKLLCSAFPVAARAIDGKGNGLFATVQIQDGEVALSDRPLCWQPLEHSESNCAVCGAFVGSHSELFKKLSGTSMALPELADAPSERSKRCSPSVICVECSPTSCAMPDEAVHELVTRQDQAADDHHLAASWNANQFLLLGAQLVHRMAKVRERDSRPATCAALHSRAALATQPLLQAARCPLCTLARGRAEVRRARRPLYGRPLPSRLRLEVSLPRPPQRPLRTDSCLRTAPLAPP